MPKRNSDLDRLEQWLRTRPAWTQEWEEDDRAGGDVLMPCKNKAPLFPHAGGAWDWDRFERYVCGGDFRQRLHQGTMELGVLCDRLYVIDVDDETVSKELEKAFPVLAQPFVPRAKTRRGFHYYFRRSVKADVEGHFSGTSMKIKGVDVKTRCSTGTSGVVIVAPSAWKTWIVKPWEGELIDVPDDLLEAVSVPVELREEDVFPAMTIAFPDGDTIPVKGLLTKCEIFSPFINDDIEETTIPFSSETPASKDAIRRLCALVDPDTLRRRPLRTSDVDAVSDLVSTADYLGMDMRFFKRVFDYHRPLNAWRVIRDLCDLDPAWARHCFDERGSDLIDVRGPLPFVPVRRPEDDRWLACDCLPRAIPAGENLLVCDDPRGLADRVWSQTPAFVQNAMRAHPGKVIVAGGWPLGRATTDHVREGRDMDVFLAVEGPNEADAVLREILSTAPNMDIICHTQCAVTATWADDELPWDERNIIQIVLQTYRSAPDILENFDNDACKIAFYWDGSSPKLVCKREWLDAVGHLAIWVDYDKWTRSAVSRTWKYYSKGFEVFLPGVERASFVPNYASASRTGVGHPGIADLFIVEKSVYRLTPRAISDPRLAKPPLTLYARPLDHEIMKTVRRHVQKVGGWESGYETDLSISNPVSLFYALRHLATKAWWWYAGANKRESAKVLVNLEDLAVVWTEARGPFRKARMRVQELFDVVGYEKRRERLRSCSEARRTESIVAGRQSLIQMVRGWFSV